MTEAVYRSFNRRHRSPLGTVAMLALSTGIGRAIIRLVLVGSVLALWEYLPLSRGVRLWLSSPSLIVAMLWHWVLDGSLWGHLFATLSVMVMGYVAGSVLGIGAGLTLGCMPRLSRVLAPFISAFYALPKIALAPLFIILLGIGAESRIVLVTLTVFFLVFNSTLDGVRDVDRDMIQCLRLMGATRGEIIRRVLVPSALPWIFTAMRISVRYAFTNTLLAELIAANKGLGFLIEFYSGNFNATGSYAAILVIIVLSVVLTNVLLRLERRNDWRRR
jgi:NitT/TauT family transport system permease protein